MNIPKSAQEQFRLMFLASVVLGGGVFAGIVVPMAHQVEELKQQRILIAGNMDIVKSAMAKAANDPNASRLILLSETTKVISEITALGARQSVTFLSFVQQDRKRSNQGKVSTLPVQLETISTFKQLGIFMDELNDMTSGIVLIDGFQVSSDKNAPEKVRSSIRMHICLKKDVNGKK